MQTFAAILVLLFIAFYVTAVYTTTKAARFTKNTYRKIRH